MRAIHLYEIQQVSGGLTKFQASSLIGSGVFLFGDAIMTSACIAFGLPVSGFVSEKLAFPAAKIILTYLGFEASNAYLGDEMKIAIKS